MLALGIIGAAFFFGDAMITPAMSVLSAVEGLKVVNHHFEPYVVPLTLAILISLFLFQYKGTAGVASLFAPVTAGVVRRRSASSASCTSGTTSRSSTPSTRRTASSMLIDQPGLALLVFGGVFLAVTGGEALYADMGHFGAKPIRLAWLASCSPA